MKDKSNVYFVDKQEKKNSYLLVFWHLVVDDSPAEVSVSQDGSDVLQGDLEIGQ